MIDSLRTAVGWRTISGRRPANQDAVLTARLEDGRELIAIADGMGGHKAGEVASERALQTILAALQRGCSLGAAVAEANTAVYRAAQENAAWRGMGTTVVVLLRSAHSYEIASVGDSRAYRVSASGIEQITRDHCLMAEALAAGGMSAEAVRHSRWRNALTRSIGTDATVEVDVFGPFELAQTHTVLLCTDGLHGTVSDSVMRRHLADISDPAAAAQRLVEEAYRNGSSDNITVAVLAFGQPAPTLNVVPRRREGTPMPQTTPRRYPIVLTAPPSERNRSWLQRLLTLFS
ncbi:MAG TPA: protein phosphatase 2C domain-containing protein [Longimicrobiales bacterium]